MYRSITADDIANANIPLRDVYDLVREGFALHAAGEIEMPPKQGVHPRPGAFTHVMPSYLPTKDLSGAKLVSVYPRNPDLGIPATTGLILMLDPATGVVTDILDATWITNIRTAMVSMVDVQFLANPNPVFGIIGATGASGCAHVEAIAEIFPGSSVIANSRSPKRCAQTRERFQDSPIDLEIDLDYESVIRRSDVVIVATSYLPEPIFDTRWLRSGHNVLNVHTRSWEPNVLDAVDLVSCDDRRQLLDPVGGITHRYPSLNPAVELGEVIVGRHPGRETPEQVVFSFNYGLGIFDILVADRILRALA